MSWKPKEFKKGMVSTVSDATGLTNDYGYKKSPVNLERSIWHEGRSRCWSAGTRSGPEGEEQRCQIHLIKQLGCVGKEPAWQLENWELRRISTRPAEMSGQSANPDKSVSKRHHIYITPILKSSCTIATISFPLSLLLPLSLPSFHIENKSKSLLTLSPTILQINSKLLHDLTLTDLCHSIAHLLPFAHYGLSNWTSFQLLKLKQLFLILEHLTLLVSLHLTLIPLCAFSLLRSQSSTTMPLESPPSLST